MKSEERDLLITEATTAHRERLRDRILPSMAYVDLDEQGRDELYVRTLRLRRLESALDDDGLSTTAHAVLAQLD
jgi:hypothetical protein